MTAPEFEAHIIAWARQQSDIHGLVLGGSRAKDGGRADHWSDWDFHLISGEPRRYYGTTWLSEIAPCLSAYSERTPRGVIKVSAIFVGGYEVDFVPLPAWQMKLVYWGMRHPDRMGWMPKRLVRGIQETRSFMLGSGYRLVFGDEKWNQRFEALNIYNWPELALSADEFAQHTAAFWTKAVWVCKKIARPELRSAMHWLNLLMVNYVYVLLAEEARLAGRAPRPEARKAEKWLDPKRLHQTAIAIKPEPAALAHVLRTEIDLFLEVSTIIAEKRNFTLKDYDPVQTWLKVELEKISG
jgi:hypothetical protein